MADAKKYLNHDKAVQIPANKLGIEVKTFLCFRGPDKSFKTTFC